MDDCTLCDMCFMVTCPYVPPHSLDIDFPHLIARYKAVELSKQKNTVPMVRNDDKFIWPNENEIVHVMDNVSRELSFKKDTYLQKLLSQVDVVSKMASVAPGIVNGLLKPKSLFRRFLQNMVGIDERAWLPSYVSIGNQLVASSKRIGKVEATKTSTRKVVLYGTCISQYNKPDIGLCKYINEVILMLEIYFGISC